MGLEFDLTDVDKFFEDEMWNIQKEMIDAGEKGVRYAEEHGDYEDHTLKLRTSNTYDVDESGVTLENTAEYAGYVESKGYDVLSGAALEVERILKERLE